MSTTTNKTETTNYQELLEKVDVLQALSEEDFVKENNKIVEDYNKTSKDESNNLFRIQQANKVLLYYIAQQNKNLEENYHEIDQLKTEIKKEEKQHQAQKEKTKIYHNIVMEAITGSPSEKAAKVVGGLLKDYLSE